MSEGLASRQRRETAKAIARRRTHFWRNPGPPGLAGLISLLSVVTLRQKYAGVSGADSASLIIAGRSLVVFHNWTFLLGPAFSAGFGNRILLGYLLYRWALVPRRMTLLGLIGGPLVFASAIATLFGAYTQTSSWSGLATVQSSFGSCRLASGSS